MTFEELKHLERVVDRMQELNRRDETCSIPHSNKILDEIHNQGWDDKDYIYVRILIDGKSEVVELRYEDLEEALVYAIEAKQNELERLQEELRNASL